ncbi:MAG: pantoate--beta-alanine ligase [Proteobacteria bacterium]|nr:pantoate--beta-alanine ligase [Pseudomonadota bacterium]
MFVAKTIKEVRNFLEQETEFGKSVSFVPTMGALHEGHLSLVKKAKEIGEISVVSIFVNKTQFNDQNDYEKYPKTLEQDLEKLRALDPSCVFIPDDSEIFPEESAFKITPKKLTDCLCGAARAGHFDGVALIITKLFNIVKPNIAIFGEKDFQQVLVIKKLVRDLNFNVEIFVQPTLREESGLAMSSRNQRLSESSKIKAANIFRILSEIKNDPKILPEKRKELLEIGFEKIDYLEIREEKNLNLVEDFSAKIPARIFIAAYLDGVRLIDNLEL